MKATQIKRLRERLALTRAQFATLIGVHVRTVRRWEEGAASPQDRHLAGLRRIQKLGAAA